MTKEELEELDRLSKDKDLDIRWKVGANPNCPIEILDRFSKDPDMNLRGGVARNPNCPVEIIIKLTVDGNTRVKETATESLSKRKETASPEEMERIEAWETLAEIGII